MISSAQAESHRKKESEQGGDSKKWGEEMPEPAPFRKYDRYKASSYRTYNSYMPTRYDSIIWHKFCQTPLYDRAVIAELGAQIASLRVLDVGCATGRLLLSLAQAGARRLCGVDLAPGILDVAREKLASHRVSAELRRADAEDSLPWPAESFDVVTMTGVLHHLYRPHDALREMRRTLRIGGRLIIIDPCFFPPLRQIFNAYLLLTPHWGDFHFYTQRSAIELLDYKGWAQTRYHRVGWASFLLTAVKSGASEAD